MDPRLIKTVLVVAGIGACPVSSAQADLYRSVSAVPVRSWPWRPEMPEGDHPGHGEGADDSPMYIGLGRYANINVTNTASGSVSVGLVASEGPADVAQNAAWLDGNVKLITSTRDFEVKPFRPASPTTAVHVRPDAKRHLEYLSARRLRNLRRS